MSIYGKLYLVITTVIILVSKMEIVNIKIAYFRNFGNLNRKEVSILEIIDKIELLLKENKKKKSELCEYLGLKKTAFSHWKSGENSSYKKHIDKIAEFFNVSIDYLLGRSEVSEIENKKTAPSKEETEIFSEHEIKLVYAYRSKPEMQPSIDKLLDIENYGNSISEDVARTLSNVPQNINTD